MFARITFAALLFAAAAPLFAFFATPPGYTLNEYTQSSGASGLAWDQAGSDFYGQHNGGIRRFDTGTNSFASTLFFTTPSGKFFDHLAIDPANPNDFYVSYSTGTNAEITKLSRTGADSATVVTSFDYASPAYYIYRLVFVPDIPTVPAALRGQLIAAATPASTFAAGIYLVDKTTLALTHLIDVGTFNGNGPVGLDSAGNVYACIPPTFGSFSGAVVRRFDANAVAAAITGSPVPSSQGVDVIAATDGVWNITAMTGRTENGQDYLYYSTYEHASVFRMNVSTGESRLFMQGFGGVADGWTHFAQGGSLAFSSTADDFAPGSAGSVRLAVPFNVTTPSFGSYNSVFLIDPGATSTNVASLVVTQQPTSINSGVPFTIEVDALDGASNPANAVVGVVASSSGVGVLSGFTVVSGPDDALDFTGLVYTTGTLPETITITIELAGNASISVTSASISVVSPATEIAVGSQPTSVDASTFFSVTTEIHDGTGTLVSQGSDASREVTATVISGTGNLWGGTTVTASNGVATFGALIVDTQGSYVIEFSSPGLTPVSINLTVDAATSGGGGEDDNNGGCSAGGHGHNWLALLGLLALIAVAARFRRVA